MYLKKKKTFFNANLLEIFLILLQLGSLIVRGGWGLIYSIFEYVLEFYKFSTSADIHWIKKSEVRRESLLSMKALSSSLVRHQILLSTVLLGFRVAYITKILFLLNELND